MEPRRVVSQKENSTLPIEQFEAAQSALITELDRLETQYGMAAERLIGLYGEGVLDPTTPESAAVARWASMCDTLTTTDKAMVALVRLRTERAHDSYQSGAPEHSETRASVIIVTDPHDAYIAFDGHGNTTRAYLGFKGYRLLQPSSYTTVQPRFDDLSSDPQFLEEPIASSVRSSDIQHSGFGDMLDVVVAGDTLLELYDSIEHQRRQHDSDPERIDAATQRLLLAAD